jgi:hypothetical protein
VPNIQSLSIQVGSIRNKINFLQIFFDEFDIIVLTEKHLDNSIGNREKEIGRNIVS